MTNLFLRQESLGAQLIAKTRIDEGNLSWMLFLTKLHAQRLDELEMNRPVDSSELWEDDGNINVTRGRRTLNIAANALEISMVFPVAQAYRSRGWVWKTSNSKGKA